MKNEYNGWRQDLRDMEEKADRKDKTNFVEVRFWAPRKKVNLIVKYIQRHGIEHFYQLCFLDMFQKDNTIKQ